MADGITTTTAPVAAGSIPVAPTFAKPSIQSNFNAEGGYDAHTTTTAPVNSSPMQTTTALRTTAATNGAKLDNTMANMTTATATKNAAAAALPVPVKGSSVTDAAGRTGVAEFDPNTGKPLADATPPPVDPNSVDGQIAALKTAATSKIAGINTTLDSLQGQVDASSNALIESIKAIYASRINDMEQSNEGVLADKTAIGIRTGRQQYAPVLQAGIISDEEQQGIGRIAALQGSMLQLIAQAQQARSASDYSAFNDKMTALDKVNTDLNTSIQSLHAAALAQQTQIDNEKSTAFNEAHTTLQDNMDKSKAAAPALVTELAGMKDPAKQAALIAETAKQLGIDPGVLAGDVQTASRTDQKAQLDMENIKNEMANRNENTAIARDKVNNAAPAGGSGLKVNKQGLFDTGSLTTLDATLSSGGTLGGTDYNPKGSDGYVDPDLYNTLYLNIKASYGEAAAQQFLNNAKTSPEKVINPANADSADLDPVIAARVAAEASKKKGGATDAPGVN